jgi:putative Mn2+ efflux pump MntP
LVFDTLPCEDCGMTFFELLLIAVGLSMDAMAVSLCAGAAGYTATPRPALRISFHFGFFQAAMPILGWLAGSAVATRVAGIDHWLAFFLLAFVAFRMVRSGLRSDALDPACDPTRGSNLLLLSVATSIDAMAVGFSMALLSTPILLPALGIGLVTFLLSYLATHMGRQLSVRFGKRMEVVGGLVLGLIGLRILLGHLLP